MAQLTAIPRAVLALERVAACAASTRLAGFVLGLNDLAKDSGIAQLPGRAAFVPVLTMAVLAARAHGLVVLDGVCNAIDDPGVLEAECRQVRDSGFDGKTLIHPAQLEVCNRVFAPSEADVTEAEAIVAAFADPANTVVERRFVFGRHTGVTLEPRVIMADYDAAQDQLTVHYSGQVPHMMQEVLATHLGLLGGI